MAALAKTSRRHRRGAILVLSAFLLIVLASITALVVDVGFLKVTKTHLQAGSDSAALAGVSQLPDGIGLGATKTPAQAQAAARSVAVQYAGLHRNGDLATSYADANRDVEIGNAIFTGGAWQIQVGVAPYNMVRVTLRRDQVGSSNGDRPLPLFFAGALGQSSATLKAPATAVMVPASAFHIDPNSNLTAGILPFAIDEPSWNQVVNNTGPDNYRYNADGTVSNGSDGLREGNLYPVGVGLPGARGTVDLGPENNSTADVERQITNGLSAEDLAYFSGTLEASEASPLTVNGDAGMSNGFKDELESIIGQPRAVPVYRAVAGEGENVVYEIIKFVPIRVMAVKLTGNPGQRYVYVQPAVLVDPTAVPNPGGTVTNETIFAPPMLIQ